MAHQKTLSEMPETLNANVRYELDLRERAIRVEEELKHQRELMVEGFIAPALAIWLYIWR